MITKFKIFENKKQQILDSELYDYVKKKASLQKVRELIKDGANVNYIASDGWTPLMRASHYMFFNCVKLLIENGANVNLLSNDGFSALMIISSDKYNFEKRKSVKDIVDILIENDVDLNIKNTKGQDIFDINDKLHKYICNKFPVEYKKYLTKKEEEKYNI